MQKPDGARRIRLVVVDDYKSGPEARAQLRAGGEAEIVGYVSSATEAFAEAERLGGDVLVVDLRMPDGDGSRVFRQAYANEESLSPQEVRVLEQVARGKTNKEIASALHLSFNTVKNYLSNAFQKLQVDGRVRAAAVFRERRGR